MADAPEKPNPNDEEPLSPDEVEGEAEVELADPDGDERSDETALVPQDPPGRYLAEIRRAPLLPRREEHRLAVESNG